MYLRDQLMKARQDDLLREAAHYRLAAAARRPPARMRLQRRASSHRSRLSCAWSGAEPALAGPHGPQGGAR